jgi:hypothetical protein
MTMNFRSTIAAAAMLAAHPAAAQPHRFEADPIVAVRENFVACEVLSQLQRVMENPRFLLGGVQEIGFVSTQAAGHTSASIHATPSRRASGRTRKRYRNEARGAATGRHPWGLFFTPAAGAPNASN